MKLFIQIVAVWLLAYGAHAADPVCDHICPNDWPVIENNYPYPGDCTKFCHCGHDGIWAKDCPAGLQFNAALQVCDWPHEANCVDAHSVCANVCPNDWPIVVSDRPYPGNCVKFCHCANDGIWAKDCPEGLYFNPQLEVCDWPSSANCVEWK